MLIICYICTFEKRIDYGYSFPICLSYHVRSNTFIIIVGNIKTTKSDKIGRKTLV